MDWIPAHFEYDGEAKVDEYFRSRVTEDNGMLTGYFRGRKLFGKAITLPDGYEARIVNGESCDTVRIWELDQLMTKSSSDFLDAVEIGKILCE